MSYEIEERFKMSNFQYLAGVILSLFVSIYILLKHPRTLVLKFLILFGFVTSLWEASVFLTRTTPNAITAANSFKITILTSHLCFPLYLLTVLNIQRERGRKFNFLIFFPAMMQVVALFQGYFDNFEFFPTEVGWSYRVVSFQPQLVVVSIVFIGYLLGIFIVLFNLTRKTKLLLLKRKYTILLFGFTFFQAIGTTLTNALIALNLLDPSFRVGGILQFLAFISIFYALSLKEEKTPLSFVSGKDFSQVYSSFLTVFYNSIISSQLGEEAFKFRDFIVKSKIENQVSLDKDTITFEETEDLNLAELITRNLNVFDKDRIDDEIVDHYLRVLNMAFQKLDWRFDAIVNSNEDFLKKSDLIYGVSEGKFLEKIVEDESLKEQNDIDACLKIYKRILLPVMNKILANSEFRKNLQKKISEDTVTNAMKITEYGEISIKKVKEEILRIPKDQRLSYTIERFNSILGWVYERLLMDPNAEVEETLRKLKLVLTLNQQKAVNLGVYPTLLGMLATKIPQTQIHKLYSNYLEDLVEERTNNLKEAQENLLKSQRLATIGEAAAIVGHDIRNPLQAMMYTLYLSKKKLESSPDNDLKKMLETMWEQVEYMNKIVSDLQDYARPLKPKLVEISLRQLIKDMLSTITIPETIKVSITIEENFPKLKVDPTFMKRVLNNLVTNALQAMPDGGKLTISGFKNDEAVLINIQDTGVGIPEENLDKIFHPLFTTKSKGQGLGLSVCKRLVEALNGSIMVESNVGRGTTFSVKIPWLSKNDFNESILIQEEMSNKVLF